MSDQLEHDANWDHSAASDDGDYFGPDGPGGRMDGTHVPSDKTEATE